LLGLVIDTFQRPAGGFVAGHLADDEVGAATEID
jgi:hypothetical protein